MARLLYNAIEVQQERTRTRKKQDNAFNKLCPLFVAAVQVQKPPLGITRDYVGRKGRYASPLQKATSTSVLPAYVALLSPFTVNAWSGPLLVALRWRHKLSVAGQESSWGWAAVPADWEA